MFMVVGDMELEAYKKTKARNPFPANPTKKGGPGNPILISRREHVILPVAGRPYTTRTKRAGRSGRSRSTWAAPASGRPRWWWRWTAAPASRSLRAVTATAASYYVVRTLRAVDSDQNCIIDNHREGAEVFHGDDICKKKTAELLRELGLPLGLLPLEDVEELGYHRESGFMWVTQKKKRDHNFRAIKQLVSYAAEVTTFVEQSKLKKITRGED
ncbi:hypothetical protein Taro_028259 [Colocasia esculenta]|uniref:Uncharacterized protein n=1 Tax=Colocasia esculenta TaxID=4460 RepID=A0A843VPX2_COLES|nr:hypothetical protein [Colocasia esculenta]